MNPVTAKQVALNNSLVSLEKRLKIEKCNARIEFSKPKGEKTYQVTLDALKLSPCYLAFMISAEVPEVYMHQFWNTIQKIKDTDAYRFKLDKKKFRVDTKVFREILQICPRFLNQDFVKPPFKDELVPFIQELGTSLGKQLDLIDLENKELKSYGYGALIPDDMINQDIKYSKAYKTYLDFATGKATPKKASKFKKVTSPSRKLSPVLEEEATVKPKRAKRHVKKSTTVLTTSVVIRETPSESVTKKKTPPKVDRGKGKDLFSDVALLEAAQLKKTLKKSKLETHKLHASGLGDSGDDDDNDDDSDKVTKDDDDVDSDADGDKEASDSEKTESDEDENPNLNQNDDEEEYVRTPDSFEFTEDGEEYEELYKDVNVRLKEIEHEEKGKGDEEMIDNGHDDITQQTTYEQVKDDEHVRHEEPSTQTLPLLNIPVKKVKDERKRYIDLVDKSVKDIIKDEVKSQLPQILLKEVSDYATPMINNFITESLKNIRSKSYQGAQEHKDLYDALVKSYKLEKDLFESYDTEMPQNHEDDLGNTNDQPNVEEASKDDWFKKHERPSTSDLDWNTTKTIDFRPP
nr:hypothetical protein [Tanacetum cinerariifolium]